MFGPLTFCMFVFLWRVGTGEDEIEKTKLQYERPSVGDIAYFAEPFHSKDEFSSRWVQSQAKKDGVEDIIAKYDGVWTIGEPKDNPLEGDHALILSSQAKHGAVSAKLSKPFTFDDKPFIVQYEVRFQNKHDCGGAYLKLLADTPSLNLEEFNDKTEYAIMFGPDRCGNDNKLHFIFQHQNPITNKMEEKHAKKPSKDFGNIFEDGKTHLVTLVVKPDNTFQILLDRTELSSGSLLSDMEPPVNPSKMIDDPNDKKPDDWDEREKIQDPEAVKPDDWDEDAPPNIPDPNATKPSDWLDDEPELIPDPAAVKPKDWDDEEDGEWEAPQIDNPKCKKQGCGEWNAPVIKNPDFKGKWTPPLIANPKYKGIWAPKKIENPNYFEDTNPFAMKSIVAVGFELWSMQSDITFDNLIISDDQSIVDQWTVQTWELKRKEEKLSDSSVSGLWEKFKDAAEEKPWLWVVAIACIFIPIMILVYCCTGSSEEVKRTARKKKTDEPETDDEHSEENEEDEKTEDEGDQETTEGEKEKKEEDIPADDDTKKEAEEKTKDEEGAEEGSQNEDEETEETSQTTRSPRRRKIRKE